MYSVIIIIPGYRRLFTKINEDKAPFFESNSNLFCLLEFNRFYVTQLDKESKKILETEVQTLKFLLYNYVKQLANNPIPEK